MSFMRSGNQLWAGAMGDLFGDVPAAGSVAVFRRPAPGGSWQFSHKFGVPEKEVNRGGFGQRVSVSGDIAAVTSVRGDIKGESRSVIYFLRDRGTDTPETVATIETAGPGEIWRGRNFHSGRLFAFCHPREAGPGGKPNSGAVYVFPRSRFPALFGAP